MAEGPFKAKVPELSDLPPLWPGSWEKPHQPWTCDAAEAQAPLPGLPIHFPKTSWFWWSLCTLSIRSIHNPSLHPVEDPVPSVSVFVNPQQALFTFHGHLQLHVMLLLTWLSYAFSFHSKWAVLQTHSINPDVKLCPFTWCPNINSKYTCARAHTHTQVHYEDFMGIK